jgi:hypothetical protein
MEAIPDQLKALIELFRLLTLKPYDYGVSQQLTELLKRKGSV